jgi:Domain of unknown function (DUF4253)
MYFPYELHFVSGSEALAKLEELRTKGVAVILGEKNRFESNCAEDHAEYTDWFGNATTDDLIASAKGINLLKWFEPGIRASAAYCSPELDWWPENPEPINSLSSFSTERDCQVALTLLPAAESWMAPCYLRTGGYNDHPEPDVHAALFRLWHEKYGATVACIADSMIEFTVTKPPTTKHESMVLAKQHFAYCPDRVDQGTGSVEALAARLLNASVWFFWWD